MTVYTRLGNGYTNAGTTSMPVIAPDGLNGNMYFETGIAGNTYIQDDTFLIYTREDGIDNTVAWREGGADFYYKYTETVNGKDCEVIIYGYNLTVGSADSAKGAQKPYAAIRMESGNMYARGGFYYSYFGVNTAYGLYAKGGYMAVEEGTFKVTDAGTCIRCEYVDPGIEDRLSISNGTFSSEYGDTVSIDGGKIILTSGTFTKNATNTPISLLEAQVGNAAIRVENGNIESASNSAKLDFEIHGSNQYGIYAKADEEENGIINVVLNRTSFTFADGGKNTGVYASLGKTEGGTKGQITLRGCTFNMGEKDVSTGQIKSQNLENTGVRVEGGTLNFEGSTSISSDGAGVLVSGGNVICRENSTINIVSAAQTGADVFDSVYVDGGSFASYGTLNITHTGLENDDQGTDNLNLYQNFIIKSYAVRVEDGSFTIVKGNIVNYCGGGVYVSGNDSTKVILGTADEQGSPLGNNDDLKVSVTPSGSNLVHDTYIKLGGENSNWNYKGNKKGGPAVKVNGGQLTIHYGTYTTMQGDGILISKGTAVVNGGRFEGRDSYYAPNSTDATIAGPAASYGFKMYGGEATIYGGTFTHYNYQGNNTADKGSGAFVMGTIGNDGKVVTGTAKIYGGEFLARGQLGFSVYEYADVTFAPYGDVENPDKGGDISVEGSAAGLGIENTNGISATVTVHGGTFTSTNASGDSSGIWCGNAYVNLTIEDGTFIGRPNENNDSQGKSGLFVAYGLAGGCINISGGTFKGGSDAGLCFNQSVSDGSIEISGGTFTSTNSAGLYFAQSVSGNAIVTINDGTFMSTNSAGLYFNAAPTDSGNAKVTINNGTFTSVSSAGLYFNANLSDGTMQIVGGTFTGPPTPDDTWVHGQYWKGGAIGVRTDEVWPGSAYNGVEIDVADIISAGSIMTIGDTQNIILKEGQIHKTLSQYEKIVVAPNASSN